MEQWEEPIQGEAQDYQKTLIDGDIFTVDRSIKYIKIIL
jgi:hypothetical protein